MSKLSKNNQKDEIQQSFIFLNEQNILTHKTFCHPYGGFHSFNNDTIDILRNEKVEYSFNVESRDIDQNDLIENPHCLPRYDCNEFIHGNAYAYKTDEIYEYLEWYYQCCKVLEEKLSRVTTRVVIDELQTQPMKVINKINAKFDLCQQVKDLDENAREKLERF